jgi:hypothetical protein
MAEGRLQALRSMVVSQAALFMSSMSGDQAADFIDGGWLRCTPAGAEPPPLPYDQAAMKKLVESGRMG